MNPETEETLALHGGGALPRTDGDEFRPDARRLGSRLA